MEQDNRAHNEAAERREYFRVEDSVILDYHVIDAVDIPELRARIDETLPDRFTASASFAATSRTMHRLLNNVNQEVPDLGRCIAALDSKLNRLSQLFMMDDLHYPLPPVRDINVSGGGMRFEARRKLNHGDALEVKLVLLPAYVGILVLGRVVYCEPAALADGDQGYTIAVEFEYLRESDRDLLMKHLLARQTEQLRRERGEAD